MPVNVVPLVMMTRLLGDTLPGQACALGVMGKTDLDEPVQDHLAYFLFVTEGQLLLGHEDAVATVELNVCPPGNRRGRKLFTPWALLPLLSLPL
jgi:hypothetical protein